MSEIIENKIFEEPYPYVQTLQEWSNNELIKVKNRSIKYLSEFFFHRVESRATVIDHKYFFTPADGVIVGAYEKIKAEESLIDVKGVNFSLRDLMQDDSIEGDYLVVSIFMTFYSQHQNYIPFSGNRLYEELPPISTFNKPMLKMEKGILEGCINPEFQEDYLRHNSREISTIFSPKLQQEYFLVRVGDYDVDVFTNLHQKDGEVSSPCLQNERFGSIVYGSQCVLAIPLYENGVKFKLRPEIQLGNYVKCKRTPLVEVIY